jgi:hypothetical protein
VVTPKVLFVVNDRGRAFNVRLVERGDRYGLDDCLTHDRDDPLVEFYDAKYAGDDRFGPRGQFVSRYYRSTLLETQADGPTDGLCLDGSNRDVWEVDEVVMTMVVRWLKMSKE